MNYGKRFEQKFKEFAQGYGFVMRIPDRTYQFHGKMLSTESEADFIAVTKRGSYLVECKATQSKALPYNKVKDNQIQSLMDFENVSERAHGILAVEFYDPTRPKTGRRAFLLPVWAYVGYQATESRRSIPISAFERLGTELVYSKGKYEVKL